MVTGKSFTSRGSSDAPDLDPSAVGLETAASNDIVSAGDLSAAMPQRPLKPQPPPKKAHLDEVIRLMKELEELREEKGQADEMTDLMGQDLQIAQEEVEKKDDELRRKETELLRCTEELKNWRQKAQDLSIEVQEERRQVAAIKESIETPEVAVPSGRGNEPGRGQELVRLRDQVANLITSLATKDAEKKEAGLQTQEELSYLRKQVEQLTTSLTEKEAQMKSIGSRSMKELVYLRKQATQLKTTVSEKDAELTKKVALAAGSAYDQWQATIQNNKLQFDNTLRETEERLNAQLAQEQELRHAAEATLQQTREETLTNAHQNQSQDTQLRMETSYKENEDRLKAQLAQEQELRRAAEAKFYDTREKMGKSSREEQELRHAAEASLRITKEEYEVKLREANERAGIQVAEMQKRAQEAETSLQEHTARVQEAGTDHENLTRRVHGLESEVEDQRKTCAWFKKNSERLSRDIKETEAARRQLVQSEYAMKRQVADLKSQVNALQPRRNMETMPGAY